MVQILVQAATHEERERAAALAAAASTRLLPERDGNGFRKLLVVLTGAGKLAALHSGNGHVVWERDYGSDSRSPASLLLPWRTSHDVEHEPQVITSLGTHLL